jgi:hypothetical protein
MEYLFINITLDDFVNAKEARESKVRELADLCREQGGVPVFPEFVQARMVRDLQSRLAWNVPTLYCFEDDSAAMQVKLTHSEFLLDGREVVAKVNELKARLEQAKLAALRAIQLEDEILREWGVNPQLVPRELDRFAKDRK